MRFFRIGDKIISEEKLSESIAEILADRESGATQEETARAHGVQRTFVSLLESLGEIRRGAKIALVAFPVENVEELHELAHKYSLDLALIVSQSQREDVEHATGAQIFNDLMDTIADLSDFDTIVVCASDKRIQTIKQIFSNTVVGIPIGPSPIREDVNVDTRELESVIQAVTSAPAPARKRSRMSSVVSRASNLVRKWER